MNRRKFILNAGLLAGAGAFSFSLGKTPIKAFARPLLNFSSTNGNILVFIQLKGGNDGLNTVIPVENSVYYTKRPTIGIAKSSALALTGSTAVALHPSLTALRSLYDQGKLAIISSVGYANPNRSHFRATDIWLTASDSAQYLYEGWSGRFLVKENPGYPTTIPAHPMAIEIGSSESLMFSTDLGGTSIAFSDPNSFYTLVSGSSVDTDPPPATIAGNELKFLKQVASQSIQYATVIKQKADSMPNKVTYPSNSLSSQLKICAQLIGGGLQTSVYLTNLSSFDTHSNELAVHQRLFGYLSDAVDAFYRDLTAMGVANKVTIVTFSEFGRRLNENASGGTDHGAAAPMFIIGNNINGGIFGGAPNLSDLDSSGDVKYIYDYRQVYASIMKDHFGIPQSDVDQILLRNFQTIPVYKGTVKTEDFADVPTSFELLQNYPNPFNPTTKISYKLAAPGNVLLKVYDTLGREIETLVNQYQSAGQHSVVFNASSALASGTYIYKLNAGNYTQTKKMMLMK